MASNRETVKKKIMLAAIALIEREGAGSLTTRKVAKKAGVNIAAINYYFGTKDELLRETFKQTLNHFFRDLETILEQKNLNIYSQLKIFLIFILKGSIRYPNFIRILLTDNLDKIHYMKDFSGKLKKFLAQAKELIIKISANKDNRKTMAFLMQILYAVLAPSLMPSIPKDFFGIDLAEEKDQFFYIDNLLQHYLTEINNEDIAKGNNTIKNILEQIFNSPDRAWE